MAFSDALTEDLNTFYNDEEFAITVTYDSVPDIPAIIDYGDSGEKNEYSDGFKAIKATIRVKKEDVAQPVYRDIVIINSVNWYVMREIQGDGTEWVCGLERAERPELV